MFALIISLVFPAFSAEKTYSEMRMVDLEAFSGMIQKKLRAAKSGSTIPLRQAFFIIMSRPDEDGAIAKVWPAYERELRARGLTDQVIKGAIAEAIAGAQNEEQPPVRQTTYFAERRPPVDGRGPTECRHPYQLGYSETY